MQKTAARLSSILLVALFSAACSADPAARQITVQAQGYVEAVPDTITLQLQSRHVAESIEEASRKADEDVRAITKLAREADVEQEDIDSSSLIAQPEYRWEKQERRFLGMAVERRVILKIRDAEDYGELLGELTELELHSISPPQLSHSKIDELRLKALQNAIDRGTVKAETIAERVDEDLGDILQVIEGGSVPQPRPVYARAEMAMRSADASAPQVNLARERISASVTMTFGLD